jgi:hypothetical protein
VDGMFVVHRTRSCDGGTVSISVGLPAICEPGSSVSTVSDYGLDDRGSIPDRGGRFFPYPLRPAGCGAHPASCTTATRDLLRS